jgi:hypothetical protein
MVVACAGLPRESQSGYAPLAGTYSLRSVNGTLPYTVYQIEDAGLALIAGTLTLARDGSVTYALTTRRTRAGIARTETTTISGAFTRTGKTCTWAARTDRPSTALLTATA